MQRKRTWLLIPSIILGITGVTSFANMLQERSHSTLNLTAQAKPSENMIRLDWTAIPNTTYKVFQRPEGSSEFNPISMTNFDNQDPVKVLNIYPSQGVPPKKVHQNDLAFSPEKQSALLNDWIKDYGLGKITVDTVNIDAFGSNPDRYLKDSSGNYKYDVLAIGFWNINYESMFLNDRGVQAVADFINYGGGVLAGHHHLGVFQLDKGLNQIKDLFGVKFVIEQGTLGLHSAPLRDTELANVDVVMPDISEAVHTSRYWYGSEKVKIEKKGLLTQYPWNIETENLLLDIPYSHNGHDFVTGDVWLSFVPGVAHNSPNGTPVKELTELPDGTTGTKGAYLSTYKNTAFIQTGHNSIVNHDTALEATEDEKKILVNTLFYLNQLSDDPYLNDHSGRDLADPVISKVDQTIDGSTFKFTVTAMDQGSTYDYYVEAQPKDGSAKLTSNIATETITTGIQGYSYVVDSNPTTEPDHTVDSTSNVITEKLSSGETYLHLKAVDGAGNVSETMHIKLEKNNASTPIDLDLTAEAKPAENMIRLDWNGLDNHTYQVFQKKEDSDEFQSISMTDLNKSKQVQVLNIYPINGHTSTSGTIPTDTPFTTWDGETLTLPQSARLKRWMEEPNSEHPRGYGQGIIEVTPIPIDQFNSNYQTILKNTDGSWKYDVIMIGTWDGRGNTTPTISNAAVDLISEFIDSGRGVLAGHDTIGYTQGTQSGLGRIREKFNIKVGHWKGSGTPDTDHNYFSGFTSTKVNLQRKGLLSNYPWDLGSPGTIFNVPLTHTTSNFAYGDIWMNLSDPDPYDDVDPQKQHTPDHLIPYAQFYLTTWNNTAMIQTGHSEGQATPDEQKILANTLFYLNQLSSDNYLNDHSGQDVKAPEKPSIKQTKVLSNDALELTFNPFVDQGSTYEYYVTGTRKDGSSTLTSNVVSETITTGVAGVSYVIDTNPDTEPDNQIDALSNNKLTIQPNHEKTTYLHLKVIDHAGNTSETLHYSISIPKINTAEQREDQIYLNWDITIPESSIIWNDDFSSKQLDLPNNIASGITIPHNGNIYDLYGNRRPDDDIVRRSVKIIDGVGINGSRGVVATQTLPNNGWNYFYYGNEDLPLSGVDVSGYRDSDWQQLKTNRPAIVRFVTKGIGEFSLSISPEWTGNGVSNEYNLTWAENLTAQELETALINKTPIKVNNPLNEPIFNFHLTTAFDHTNSYNFKLSLGHITKNNSDGNWYYTSHSWYGPWCDAVKPGQYVTPENQRNVESITVGKSLSQLQGSPSGHNQIAFNTPDWTNYSMNIYIPNSPEIAAVGNYFRMTAAFKSASQFYLDDLVVAYAPKSRLYRDGKLILEDYSVEHTDADVQDTAAPEKVIVSADYVNGKLQLTWKEVKDKGTTYTYEVSGVDENGMESLRSEPKEVEFISGVKEYRIYLNGTLIDKTTTPNYQFKDKITSSDRVEVGVVDEADNETKTQIDFLTLTAEAKPSKNMIRLDWTSLNESTYQVYQKKEGNKEFQSISMTDLSKNQQVRVLNIYPTSCWELSEGCLYNGQIPLDSTFTTWDGETLTLHQSARLKRWMEEPNTEHPKGYGQGIIEVTPIAIEEFNNEPSNHLKNPDGTWKYDVVMFGTWDSNGWDDDINGEAQNVLIDFIESNQGILFGHDTLRGITETHGQLSPNLASLASYVNLSLNNINYDEALWHRSSFVKVSKKGLLINYPWNIGDIGTVLSIPQTHTVNQVPNGDIWLKFEKTSAPDKFNYYLTTWNNAAMIQTGHSNGEATPDEQKILANTLFYLNQLSSNNYLNDYSGQDVKGPETPSIKTTQSTNDGYLELTFNPFVDQGSTYDYYVKASPKNGSSSTVSNIATETITSGIAGVSYIIDTNPNTVPDDQLDTLANNKLKVKLSETKTVYIHLKVIDHAGNTSETLHIPVTEPPVLRSEVVDNEYVRLDWTTPLLPENILWESSFEPDDDRPLISYFGNKGNQSIDSSTSFSGKSSLKVGDALNRKPNFFDTSKDVFVDVTQFDRIKNVFTNQMSISIQIKAKASRENDNAYISLLIAGGREFKLTDFGVTVAEFTRAGSTKIKINNPNSFKFKTPYDVIDFSNQDSYIWGGDLSSGLNYLDLNPDMYSTSGIDSDGYLYLRSPLTRDLQVGESIKVRKWVDPIDEFLRPIASTEWETIQYNTTITNMEYLDMLTLGCYFNIKTFTEGQDIYIDNLSVSTPVKVKLYRDNQLIYEGFENQLNDLEATDKTAPSVIKNAQLTVTSLKSGGHQFNIQFDQPEDYGSTYDYQISSVNAYGMESLKSNPTSETVTSGIKGYSYLIDKNPTTEPDNFVDLTKDQRKISYSGNGTHYLHIKTIDNAGNASKTLHLPLSTLELTAEAKPSENMIRLDWNFLTNSTYQVYQKKEGNDEFQSISMTDLNDVEQVQVLNIYPYRPTDAAMTSISFTTWDGENLTLPKSAALKMWMEQPVPNYPKGFGMGKIEVTAVSQVDFNTNPERYLKNADGSWKYDVIANGFWDNNAENDYTQESLNLIKEFIAAGKGYLVGHDTLVSLNPYYPRLSNELRHFANIKFPQDLGLSGDSFGGNDYQTATEVTLRKKGLLTNYPHQIGDIGTVLTIPKTHNSGQMAYGDIWLDFTSHTGTSDSTGKGITNHYLTTFNNVAMIQTGHAIGEATSDEQKILANTLFYLNQLSSENYLNDHSGQDIKAPDQPSVLKTELLPNGFIELQFNELIDRGSTYEYYVKATHKSGYEQVSNTVKETITTGIKGVSYVIDTHPNTEPDDQVDAFDINTLQIKPNPSQTTYLHIKVIDQAGNSSETLHYVLDLMTLTAQAKPAENEGKGLVRLDWTEKPDHTYQVYQKKEGANEFQIVGTTNFNTTKQVRVLNVYPLINVYDEPYTTWDGEFVPSQHKSAVLKEWMEKPNAEDPKGYGKGLIKVHPVTFDQFNQDPMSYLKNADGEWAYDVVMFGSADSNDNQDLNQKSYLATKAFLDSGRGVLFRHDTVTQWQDMNYLPMLSNYINVTTYSFIGDTTNTNNPANNWIMPWSGGTQVELVRDGLFNTYPWKIGEVGEILTIPYTHTNSQVAKGDVWLKFKNPHPDSNTNVPIDYNEYNDNGIGTNMAYLTTWNNAAMIQTGHAINRLNATPDEQKIMANTLFYLNQLSSENWLDDYSGQDLKAPETPSIKNHTYRADSLIELNFEAVQDNGSTYEYYVKATHKDGSGIALSNIASATVTTGVKGYSWIADSNPDTIPDENIEQTNNQTIQIPTNNQGPYYLHIKAIDKAGNASETFHYELTDTTKPTFTLTQNPTDWTNQDVIITVDAADGGTIPSGIKEIILPDGNKVSGDTATFTAIENGTYTFEVVDFMGNRQTESLTISNIDKIKPTGSIIIDQDQEEFYEEETELHLSMSDILDGQEKLSGIATVEIFDVNGTYSYTLTNPTDYQPTIPWVLVPYEMPDGSLKAQVGMTLTDKAGNTTTVYSKEVTIIKVRIDEFHLTDVINPRIYNSQNPFQRLSYPYIPSQELLVGGSFEFEAIYTYPPTVNSSWKATYEANIHYIHPTDGTTTIPLVLEKQSVDGQFTARHAIPLTAKVGTDVYLELRVAVYNSSGKLMGEDTFPDPAGTLLKIGEITGDIRELLQFNEIY